MRKAFLLRVFNACFRNRWLNLAVFTLCAGMAQAQTPCSSITAYGGNGNGSADNVAAFSSAVAALTARGGCIAFPAGTYAFNSAVTVNYPTGIFSLSIVGAGSDNTTLLFPASHGITINAQNTGSQALQSIHIRDLTFATGNSTGLYVALTLSKPGASEPAAQSEVERCVFRGADGVNLNDFWAAAVNVLGLSNINFDGDLFYGMGIGTAAGTLGIGISLAGNSASGIGSAYNIAKSGFFSTGTGVLVGSYVNNLTFTQSNIVNGATCIWVPASETGIAGITITGGNNLNCQQTQILLQSAVNNFVMNGNLIYVGGAISPNNVGLWIAAPGGQQYSIVNNVFASLGCCGPSATGILANFSGSGVVKDGVVMGNTFYNLSLGVDLTSASYWNVQANFYNPSIPIQVSNPTLANMNTVGVATK